MSLACLFFLLSFFLLLFFFFSYFFSAPNVLEQVAGFLNLSCYRSVPDILSAIFYWVV